MKVVEHKKQLGIPTLGYVFAKGAHVRRFVRPKTEHEALYNHVRRDMLGLFSLWGEGGVS